MYVFTMDDLGLTLCSNIRKFALQHHITALAQIGLLLGEATTA